MNGYLASLDDFAVYNEVYLEHFTTPLPARTTVEAGLWGIKVEVEAWARRAPSGPSTDQIAALGR